MRFLVSFKRVLANQVLVIRRSSTQMVTDCVGPGLYILLPGESAAERISTEFRRITVNVAGHSHDGQKIILTLMIPFRLDPLTTRLNREQLYKVMATNANVLLHNWIKEIVGREMRNIRAAGFTQRARMNWLERTIRERLVEKMANTGYVLEGMVSIIDIRRETLIEENKELAMLAQSISKDDIFKTTFLKQRPGQQDVISLLALRLLADGMGSSNGEAATAEP